MNNTNYYLYVNDRETGGRINGLEGELFRTKDEMVRSLDKMYCPTAQEVVDFLLLGQVDISRHNVLVAWDELDLDAEVSNE